MKRTGIFAAAVAGAVGATALVGGVGYTLAQEVAEQNGAPLDLGPVATVEPGQQHVSTSMGSGTTTETAPDDAAPDDTAPDGTAGDGTGSGPGTDAGSPAAGGAAPVAPAPPVAIDPGKKGDHPEHPWRGDPRGDRGHDDARHPDPRGDQGGWSPDPGRGGGGGADEPRRGGGGGHHGGGGHGGHH
jgi:hypothetical protein